MSSNNEPLPDILGCDHSIWAGLTGSIVALIMSTILSMHKATCKEGPRPEQNVENLLQRYAREAEGFMANLPRFCPPLPTESKTSPRRIKLEVVSPSASYCSCSDSECDCESSEQQTELTCTCLDEAEEQINALQEDFVHISSYLTDQASQAAKQVSTHEEYAQGSDVAFTPDQATQSCSCQTQGVDTKDEGTTSRSVAQLASEVADESSRYGRDRATDKPDMLIDQKDAGTIGEPVQPGEDQGILTKSDVGSGTSVGHKGTAITDFPLQPTKDEGLVTRGEERTSVSVSAASKEALAGKARTSSERLIGDESIKDGEEGRKSPPRTGSPRKIDQLETIPEKEGAVESKDKGGEFIKGDIRSREGSGEAIKGDTKSRDISGEPTKDVTKPTEISGEAIKGDTKSGEVGEEPIKDITKSRESTGEPTKEDTKSRESGGEPTKGVAKPREGSGESIKGATKSRESSEEPTKGDIKARESSKASIKGIKPRESSGGFAGDVPKSREGSAKSVEGVVKSRDDDRGSIKTTESRKKSPKQSSSQLKADEQERPSSKRGRSKQLESDSKQSSLGKADDGRKSPSKRSASSRQSAGSKAESETSAKRKGSVKKTKEPSDRSISQRRGSPGKSGDSKELDKSSRKLSKTSKDESQKKTLSPGQSITVISDKRLPEKSTSELISSVVMSEERASGLLSPTKQGDVTARSEEGRASPAERPGLEPGAPTERPGVAPGSPTERPGVAPGAPTEQPGLEPGAPTARPGLAPGAPTERPGFEPGAPGVAPGAPTERPGFEPGAPTERPGVVSRAPTERPSLAPGAATGRPGFEPGAPTERLGVAPGAPTEWPGVVSGAPTERPGVAPGAPTEWPGMVSATPTGRPGLAPGAATERPGMAPGIPTERLGSVIRPTGSPVERPFRSPSSERSGLPAKRPISPSQSPYEQFVERPTAPFERPLSSFERGSVAEAAELIEVERPDLCFCTKEPIDTAAAEAQIKAWVERLSTTERTLNMLRVKIADLNGVLKQPGKCTCTKLNEREQVRSKQPSPRASAAASASKPPCCCTVFPDRIRAEPLRPPPRPQSPRVSSPHRHPCLGPSVLSRMGVPSDPSLLLQQIPLMPKQAIPIQPGYLQDSSHVHEFCRPRSPRTRTRSPAMDYCTCGPKQY